MAGIGSTIVDPARVALGYAQMLLKDIEPDQFRRMPKGYDINSPAWNFGHLAIYPDKAVLPLIGRADLAQSVDDFDPLFNAKSECKDDPKGAIYPGLETISTRFFKRSEAVIAVVAETPDDVFLKPLPPDHFFASRMKSVGGVVNFMLNDHVMSHLGQVSAWRRVMGLGHAM